MKTTFTLLLALLCLNQVKIQAQTEVHDAFAQNRRLGRGVNILGYDPIWRSRDQARFQQKFFRQLKDAGFDSVRINLHGFRQMAATNDWKLRAPWFEVLDWAVKGAQNAGLAAILDLHEYNAMGEDPATNKVKFLAFWKQVSTRYQHAPNTVYFEILNEPARNLTPSLWNDYLREALAIIRATNPTRTVIIGPASWNSIDHLHELELPADDRHLIVTVHYYQPMDFTHQGAAWASRQDKLGVDWAGSPEDLARITRDFDTAATWAREQNRPVLLGEFGAYDKAEMAARARYCRSVARAAEERGWSWAYWQFDSDFILYDVKREVWVEPILQALIPQPVNTR